MDIRRRSIIPEKKPLQIMVDQPMSLYLSPVTVPR